MSDLRIRARMPDFTDHVELAGLLRVDGAKSVAQPLTMSPVPSGGYVEAFARLSAESAQELMDDLWRCGLRPSEGGGSAGSLAATQRHLEDMRTLVFQKASGA
jgi:hypothetical protein